MRRRRARSPLQVVLSVLCAVVLVSPALATAAPSLKLSASGATSQEGFLTFSWQPADGAPAALELALDSGFARPVRTVPLNSQILEKGQVHISGLQDGEYVARLVSESYEPLSNVVRFDVRHRSLKLALLIFSVGAVLFTILLALVFRFSRQES